MTRHVPVLASLVALLMGCSAPPSATTNTPEELLAAAEELDSLFLAAFNQGDAEALSQLYWNNPELRLYPPGEAQVSGFEAAKGSFQRDFSNFKGATLEYTDVHNLVLGDGVVGYGTFRWTMPMDSAPPMVMEGRYTEVKAMRDGKMVILLDHASAPMMPPPEEAPADTTKQR